MKTLKHFKWLILFAAYGFSIFSILIVVVTVNANAVTIEEIQDDLFNRFNTLTEDPEGYRQLVTRECSMYPEGTLFPYTFPAIAYICYQQENSKEKAEVLLFLAGEAVERQMGTPLLELKDYEQQGTFLGQYNLALSLFNSHYKNDQLKVLNDHITELLVKAFLENNYEQISSYPEYTWTFDSIPALVSIKYNDAIPESKKTVLVDRHLKWLREKASDQSLGLPNSIVWHSEIVGPRGCDLSLRIPLIYHLDKSYAEELYDAYCDHFWKLGIVSGFREWSAGNKHGDVDSGPIIMGVGSSATAMAYPNFEIFDDSYRRTIYLVYLSNGGIIKSLVVGNQYIDNFIGITVDDRYFSGSLFSDCVLFYSVLWHTLDINQD